MRTESASPNTGKSAANQSTSSASSAREIDSDRAPTREPRRTAQVTHLHGDGTQRRTAHPTRVAAAAADACGATAPTLRVSGPKQQQQTFPDCPGLVRITYPSGRATWFFDYRHPVTGKRTKALIGPANEKSAWPKGRKRGAANARPSSTDDAMIQANALREALARGIVPADIGLTVEEFVLGRYVEACRRANKRSLPGDLVRFRKHLSAAIGALALAKVHRLHLVSALDRLSAAGMSPATRNRVNALLRAIWGVAKDLGLIEVSPADDLPWLKEHTPKPTSFEREELARLGQALETATEFLQVFAGIAATTAMRSGEVQRMKWEDIDYEASQILLPVTKSGEVQEVELTPAVRAYLDIAATWRRDGNPYVFPRPRARTPLPVPREEWHKVLERAKLPKQGFHVLRRTWATLAAYADVPLITISRGLRHASISTTDRHYLATNRDKQHAAAAEVGDLVRNAMGARPADLPPCPAAASRLQHFDLSVPPLQPLTQGDSYDPQD